MAKAEDNKKDKKAKEEGQEKKSAIKRLLPIIILVVVVGVCAGAGIGLGKILAGPSGEVVAKGEGDENLTGEEAVDLGNESKKFWYYDLEPAVVANLNEPGVTRYVSASLTLQMNLENEKDTRAFLDEKTPILRNWLYIFLSGLCIEDIKGDKNLKSIQSQICDGFNKELFPNSKPQIKQILIREFPIQ